MPWEETAERPIADALFGGDFDTFAKLLNQYPDNLRNAQGFCAWMEFAAWNGQLPFIKLLVEKYGIGVNEPVDEAPDYTAILMATENGKSEVVRWLLDDGAEINFEYDGRQRCESLIAAVVRGDSDIVKLLVERGANIHATNNSTLNVATFADRCGNFAIRDYLLSLGAKDLRETTPRDFPAAHKQIIDAMTEERGPLADWQVEIPGDPAVTIYLIPANEQCDHDTLFTVGLSDKNLPQGPHRFTHHELRIMLKRGWPLTDAALSDPLYNWPVEWLKRIVRELLAGDRWPEEPILFMNGDPPLPLAPKTKLCGWLCLRSMGEEIPLPDHRFANIHSLFALHAKEAEFVRQHGSDELVERFQDREVPISLNPKRKSIV